MKLDYDGVFVVDSRGRSGGLALLWRKEASVSLLSFSRFHIGFYGNSDRGHRHESWQLLRHLSKVSPLPWCCLGDFNDILAASEKR